MKTIVAAIDFSNAMPGVIQSAAQIAQKFQAHLRLLHVIEPEPSYTAYGFTPDEFPALHAYQQEAKRRAAGKLEEALTQAREQVSECSTKILEGSPLHCLLDHVQETHADMVVLGSHGHGFIASLLLGSVAEGMIRKATILTLIVPAPARD